MISPVEIKTADGICDSWLAEPSEEGPWPAVIFCMDAVGPRAVLKEMADRLASYGFVVLLPNLFYRDQSAPLVTGVDFPVRVEEIPRVLQQIMPLVERFDSKAALRDMAVFLDYLSKQKKVRSGKIAIYGYCMGGAMAIRTAAAFPDRFAAVASFHAGGLVTEAPDSPHRELEKIRAALYVGHADQDPHMSAEQIEEFDKAASFLTVPHREELYRGAQHHFTMADLPAYDPLAAEKHWERLVELFRGAFTSTP